MSESRFDRQYLDGRCGRRARWGMALLMAGMMPAAGWGATTGPTIANNVFASTPVGGSLTQTVTLTLTSVETIQSIAIEAGVPGATEYTLLGVTGCAVDGVTQSAVGTVCNLSVKFTPQLPGSTTSPVFARNATVLFTDKSGSAYAYGLTGAATGPVAKVVPGNISLYAGTAATGLNALDVGLGSVTGGYGGDGGPALSATFNLTGLSATNSLLTQPLAMDSAGNLYVADAGNYVIRKIDNTAEHTVTTIAGTPKVTGTSAGSGGPATSATLAFPHALVVDAAGDIYFIDASSQYSTYGIVYRIDAATKMLTAMGGQNYNPTDGYNSAQGGGTCVADLGTPGYYECGDGGLAAYASLPNVRNLAMDAAGNLYLWEYGGYIRKIAAGTGIITTVATAADFPSNVAGTPSFALGGMTLGSDGNFYVLVAAGTYELIYAFDPTTQAVTLVAGGQQPNYTGTCDTGGGVYGNPSAPSVEIAEGQAGYPGAQLFVFTNGVVASTGDLSSDASGNIYYSGAQCNTPDVYDYRPAVFRINLPTDTVYLETVGGSSGTATRNYNAYSGFSIAPASAIPDGNGNVYFTTNNQIAVVSAAAGALDFGQTNEFTTGITQIATYENVGNATGTAPTYGLVSGLDFTDVSATDTNACDLLTQLAVNKTCNIDYAFTPTQPNEITDTMKLAEATPGGNAGFGLTTSAQTMTLTGDANPEAQFVVTPSSLNFGDVAVGQSATLTFTVSNPGAETLGLYGISLYPNGASNPPTEYTLGGTCDPGSSDVMVNAGASCTVTVTFTPTTATTYPTTLTINNSVTNPEAATFAITGTGSSATVATATLSPSPLVFPQVAVGSYSSGTATLTNTGTTELTNVVASVTGSGAGAFSFYPTGTCGSTLAAGASCTYVLHFSPSAAGGDAAMLSVADNANGSPQTIALSGAGTPAAAAEMQFTPTVLSAIAGTGTMPANCVDPAEPGPALQTQLCGPTAVAVDYAGNVYIAEPSENVVKKLDTSGNLTTFAGVENNGAGSYGGDNGPANAAHLSQPLGVAVDGLGNVYISDSGNGRIREVSAATGTITTFVGGASGTYFNGGTGTGVTLSPAGIAFDPAGNLYIAEPTQQIVVKVNASGAASLFAGVQASGGAGVAGYNGDNMQATAAELNAPTSVATDRAGNVYIADSLNYRVRYVNENAEAGMISTAAGNGTKGDTGDGGSAASAEITPLAIAMNEGGDLFISDGTTLRKVDNQGNITTFAGGGSGGLGGPATSALLQGVGQPGIDNVGDVLIPVAGTPEVLSAGPAGILQFGSQAVGTTSSALTITVENTGNGFLNFTNSTYSASGDFQVTGGTCEEETDGGWAPGETCTLTVTFTPTATGARTGSVSVPSNATGSPSSIMLQGTGTMVAAPGATVSPSTLSFGNTVTGTTAAAQVITLSNPGNAVLDISGISIGGTNAADFAETTTCGETLAAGAMCTISVTFTPASIASFAASVSIADNAAGSPQTVALSGAGIAAPDFSVSALPATQTVSAGSVATYNVTVSAVNGDFSSAVTLGASGLPTGATATFAPAEVTPGGESATSVMTVQTSSSIARAAPPSAGWRWMPGATMALCIPLLWWRRRARARLWSAGLVCALLWTGLSTLGGCGGGYYAVPPAQTYTITVTGSSGSVQHSTTVTLTVQ